MIHSRKIVVAGASALLAISSIGGATLASSHREAPLIALDPSADITDLYAFVSPDDSSKVTLIANYTGFQDPAGGPNFYSFDPNVQYWIYIDNNGDGVEDVEYTFEFKTQVANPDSFLYSGYGPIPGTPSNVTQTYTVSRNGVPIGTDLDVPAPNIGPRTTPSYKDIGMDGIHTLGGGRKVFVGQRDDPFFVDVGAIFDLAGLRPFNPAHLIPLAADSGQDSLGGFNVNSIALQVPKGDLTSVTSAGGSSSFGTVGIWGGASRHATTVLAGDGTSVGTGPWIQVSRLGNPLINEVVIPIGEKDYWNASEPVNDAQFKSRYENPELSAIINTVYPSLPDADTSGRSDLVLILGQGIPGLNQTNSGNTLYDYLRLNLDIAPTLDHPNRLSVVLGDAGGWPNGRRLFDSVVDIELRAFAQGYGKYLHDNFGLPNKKPNNTLAQGCRFNDKAFTQHFPYVASPWSGYAGGDYRVSPCQRHGSAPTNDAPHFAGSASGLWTQTRVAMTHRFFAS